MSILDRDSLEQSSLADLHAIASELSIDSFRRLRKAELIDAILERQSPTAEDSGEEAREADELSAAVADEPQDRDQESRPRRRRLRRGRRRAGDDQDESSDGASAADGEADQADQADEPEPVPVRDEPVEPELAEPEPAQSEDRDADEAEGVIEVLGGGSGFVRINPPDPSDEDVYVSAAQVRRFELVSGDRVSGPRRPPRRSERFASLVRVETVNGRPVSELGEAVPFDERPVGWPRESLELATVDPTVSAVLSVVPLGRGSRVTVVGPPQSGKTETIRRLASALAGSEELDVQLVLCGVRPEEIADWHDGPLRPAAALPLGASAEARAAAVESVTDQARRLAVRGTHAVVLIDTLDGLAETVKTKALATARRLADAGSVTVIATSSQPLGGETGVVGLSALLAAAGRWPAVDPARSWTMRPELLVGVARAEEIGRARAQALDG